MAWRPDFRELFAAAGELMAMADSAQAARAFILEEKLRDLARWCEMEAKHALSHVQEDE